MGKSSLSIGCAGPEHLMRSMLLRVRGGEGEHRMGAGAITTCVAFDRHLAEPLDMSALLVTHWRLQTPPQSPHLRSTEQSQDAGEEEGSHTDD